MANQASLQSAAIAAFVALVIVSGPAAADIGLDPAFGNGGKIFVNFGAQDVPRALLLAPDGKLLMAGFANLAGSGDDIAMSRHLPNGSLDQAEFGIGGKVVHQYLWRDQVNGMALQPDGKIVAVGIGAASNAGSVHVSSIYRFNADGSTDSTFSDDGWTALRYDAISGGEFADVCVLPDGKILAAGVCRGNINGGRNGFGAMRFLPNGDLDPSYGARFYELSNLVSGPGHAVFTPDGGIIFANQIWPTAGPEFVLLRLDAFGDRDFSFGTGGFVFPGIPTENSHYDTPICLLPDGRILLAGTTAYGANLRQYTVLRLESNGVLDPTFGTLGRTDIRIGPESRCYGMTVAPSGKILVVGTGTPGVGQAAQAGAARLTADGVLDSGFAPGGTFMVDLLQNASDFFVQCVVDGGGGIIACGQAGSDFVLARLTSPVAGVDATPWAGNAIALSVAPNPTRGASRVDFSLARSAEVQLSVFDSRGRRIRTLAGEQFPPGNASVAWDGTGDDGRSVAPGVYFVRLAVDGRTAGEPSRVVLVR